MTDNKNNNHKQILALGIAITLPMILVSGPLAGYVLGRYILVKYLNLPGFIIPVLVILGFIASGVQTYRLIQKVKDLD